MPALTWEESISSEITVLQCRTNAIWTFLAWSEVRERFSPNIRFILDILVFLFCAMLSGAVNIVSNILLVHFNQPSFFVALLVTYSAGYKFGLIFSHFFGRPFDSYVFHPLQMNLFVIAVTNLLGGYFRF